MPSTASPARPRSRTTSRRCTQVLGRDGLRSRKVTVLVAPLRTIDIDFDTDNPGRWIAHCHSTYHLEAGMATFIEYT